MGDDSRDLTECSVPELLERFVANLHEFENIDHTGRKNRVYAKRRRILEAIKGCSDGTLRALQPFLSDPDPMVRYLSATYYREVDHAVYVKTLEEFAARRDELGARARSALEWLKRMQETPPATSEPRPSYPPNCWKLCGQKPPKGISRDQIEPMLFDAFPREVAIRLLALTRSAIRVWPQPFDPNAPLTCSRFGGLPAAPRDWSWPAVPVEPAYGSPWRKLPREKWPKFDECEPRWFIGQINCADLAGFQCAAALPREGLLSFFADSDVVTGCIGGGDRDCVFYWRSEEQLRLAPTPAEDFEVLPSCTLGFAEMLDLPDPESDEIKELSLDEKLRESYYDLHKVIGSYGVKATRYSQIDRSKLFGWPDLVQYELTDIEARDPRLLLQVGSYDNGSDIYGWGPGGLIYFVIDAADLAQKAFTRTECDFQCT